MKGREMTSALLNLRLKIGNILYHIFFNLWSESLSSCTSYYVCLTRSAIFISALAITQRYIEYSVRGMMVPILFYTFPENSLFIKVVVHANLLEGLVALLHPPILYVSDVFRCYPKLIFCLCAAYTWGLLLLWLGYDYDLQSQSKVGVLVFYMMTIPMLAIGILSKPLLEDFFNYQLMNYEDEGNENFDRIEGRSSVWIFVAWLLALLPNNLLSSLQFQTTFCVSTAMMMVSMFMFACGTSFYASMPRSYIHTVTVVIRVLKAMFLKRNLSCPENNCDKFYQNQGNEVILSPHLRYFRWLDRAAIVESTLLGTPEDQEKEGRLCSVTQVKQAKLVLITMLLICPASVGLGLVNAAGNTFFVLQAINMDPQISITTLLMIKSVSKFVAPYLLDWLFIGLIIPGKARTRSRIMLKIFAGMVLCVICCVVTWHVEVQRLRIVEENGLVEDPTIIIPMSTWKLAPQFFLLGCAYGVTKGGMDDFQEDYVSKSVTPLPELLVMIFGSFLNILILVLGRSWFGDSLNSTSLDKYFLLILGMASMAIIMFGLGILLFNALNAQLELQVAIKLSDNIQVVVESQVVEGAEGDGDLKSQGLIKCNVEEAEACLDDDQMTTPVHFRDMSEARTIRFRLSHKNLQYSDSGDSVDL